MASLIAMELITYRGEGLTMGKSGFSLGKDGKRLHLHKGEEAVAVAGITGSLFYFAEHKLHGFMSCLSTMNGSPKFWWLFADPSKPRKGLAKPVGWYTNQQYVARMSVAEYVTCAMNCLLEKRVDDDPAFLQTPRDELLAQLMVMFAKSYGSPEMAAVMSVMPEYDNDQGNICLSAQVVRFAEDGSRMLVDSSGYTVIMDDVCVVPEKVVGAKPEFRYVTLQDAQKFASASWH